MSNALQSIGAMRLTARAAQAGNPKAHPLVQQMTRLRILQGLSAAELATRAGCAFATIKAIEQGRTKSPSVATLEACYAALNFKLQPVSLVDGWKVDA